ncbi:hypothetical protein GEV43_12655 [Actinomadura sp. J1-007]|nr:hypothetical protein [Actinomadura sp. J1-007]
MFVMITTTLGVDAESPCVLEWRALPSASTPGTVRLLLEQRLAGRGLLSALGGRADDLYLVTSELVTNACEETPHAEIVYRATLGREGVWIGVWDGSDEIPCEPPGVRELSFEELDAMPEGQVEHGRGLELVAGLAAVRGVTVTPPHGKWVWAEVPYPDGSTGR